MIEFSIIVKNLVLKLSFLIMSIENVFFTHVIKHNHTDFKILAIYLQFLKTFLSININFYDKYLYYF
jgi:hypothetical protein